MRLSLFGELSRRNVFRVGIAYVIAAWVIAQVADLVLENIGAPDWVMQAIMLVLALGFPVVLLFSWAYEVTPEGIKKESEVDRSESITNVTGRKLNNAITALLVVALAYFVWESRSGERPVDEATVVNTSENAEVITTDPADLSIAVLPFENRSNREEDQFFVDGMHDDLLTTLAKVGSMKVISRTSVMEYRNQPEKKIPEIARELGVANILEGGVQRAGNHVRINVQLIDADTDEHLWAEIYDRELTIENLFAIQSEISSAIAEALHTTLSPEEQERIGLAKTSNLEAWDAYQRGKQLMETRVTAKLEEALTEFQKAVSLDPNFALAWVGTADAYFHLTFYGSVDRIRGLELREAAVNRALELDPELGEAYASLSQIYEDRSDRDEAEALLLRSIELSPNYATAHHWLSNMLRNDRRRTRDALVYARKAKELDPRSAIISSNLASHLIVVGEFEEAEEEMQRNLEIHPDFVQGFAALGWLKILRGELAEGLATWEAMVERNPDNPGYQSSVAFGYVAIGAMDSANKTMAIMQERFSDHPQTLMTAVLVELENGRQQAALNVANELLSRDLDYETRIDLAINLAEHRLHDAALQHLQLFDDLGDWTNPELWEAMIPFLNARMCYIANVLVETGKRELGQQMARMAADYYEDVVIPAGRGDTGRPFVSCYLVAGDSESALQLIERQLELNRVSFWGYDHKIAAFDAIRENPRYVAALESREEWLTGERRKAGLVRTRAAPN